MREPIIGYMCKVDFDHELGEAADGNHVFASVKDLKRYRKCWKECGIVEVETKLRRVIYGRDGRKMPADLSQSGNAERKAHSSVGRAIPSQVYSEQNVD